MTFNPDEYWPQMGQWLAGPGAATPEHKEAEALLAELLPSLSSIEDVLDVGCGRGRLASLLLEVLPAISYAGVDIGAEQLAATQKVRPEGEFFLSRLQDFDPGRKWDLVIVSEVLMHIPPSDIQASCVKVKKLARKWLITIDWTEPVPEPISEVNWLHPYRELLGRPQEAISTGLQTIFVFRR